MLRQVIKIDEEKCNGCGICANACHEGAIDIVNGKAKLVRENFCDGFGDCLPGCPMGAITFENRDVPEYDEAAVLKAKAEKAAAAASKAAVTNAAGSKEGGSKPAVSTPAVSMPAVSIPAISTPAVSGPVPGHSCPGSAMRSISRPQSAAIPFAGNLSAPQSQLVNWPVQIKLAPLKAPYFDNANLLIAADCTAYSYAAFHQDFIRNRVCLIGCPKLDSIDYSEKLTEIIRRNNIKSVTIVRMEVPCCGGLERAAKKAIQGSGKFLPWQVYTISIDGKILD